MTSRPKTLISFGFAVLAFFLVSQKIFLTTADLGRYLQAGRLFFQTGQIIRTNFFSYTYSNFPFVNHHWAIAPLFYAIKSLFGFAGLSVFYALLIAGAVFLITHLAQQQAPRRWVIFSTILLLPLLTYRREVRPEGISFLFLASDIYLLSAFLQKHLSFATLALIYLLTQLFWVNCHIFWVFGSGLAGLALFSLIITRRQFSRPLFFLLLASIFVNLLNPFGLSGFLAPFRIFHNYGYMVLENQSLFFALHRLANFVFWETALLLLPIFLASLFLLTSRRPVNFFLGSTSLFFLFLAGRYLRTIPFLGLIALPVVSIALAQISHRLHFQPSNQRLAIGLFLGLLAWLAVIFPSPYSLWHQPYFGWGLAPQAADAAHFLDHNHLRGPIFNNYDSGSYLIWALYPREKVFVDNRPEAYPAQFFQKVYIPAQKDDHIWRQVDQRYHFNLIVFYRRDATPWGQPFLIRRLRDPAWAPVYVDPYVLILLRNSPANQKFIQTHRLPASLFHISH